MKFNGIDLQELGGGVILFKNAFSIDWDFTRKLFEEFVVAEREQMYTEGINPETGEPCYINRSGYIFDKEGVDMMPRRAANTHQDKRPEVIELLSFLESARDQCLLAYMTVHPLAYKNIWWKVKGHIVSYSTHKGGLFLGTHSDSSVDYLYGIDHPKEQLPTKNTLSVVMYINDCVPEGEVVDGTFSGGEHVFDYLNISYSPSKGDILMFPSNFIASHEVKKVTGGTRYSYLGWYSHGSPNPSLNETIVDPITDAEEAQRSTNVYMPNLRKDFRDYLTAHVKDPEHLGFTLTSRMN
jgi:predicted 2-oxoglutarate/Fe(II)-dependent dioxygenase YbiX